MYLIIENVVIKKLTELYSAAYRINDYSGYETCTRNGPSGLMNTTQIHDLQLVTCVKY